MSQHVVYTVAYSVLYRYDAQNVREPTYLDDLLCAEIDGKVWNPLQAYNTVSTPVFLSQHIVSQHLFWRLNTCLLAQICVSTLKRKP